MGGFVVVAPLFPDENANKINSLVPRTVTQSELAESDVVNEPYDIAYVTGEVSLLPAVPPRAVAAWLKGLAEPGKIALAGHSDGAQAVAALVYAEKYAATYEAMPSRPFGVVVLSGSELSGTYAPPAEAQRCSSCRVPSTAATCPRKPARCSTTPRWLLPGAFRSTPFLPVRRCGPGCADSREAHGRLLEERARGTPSLKKLSAFDTSPGVAKLYGPLKPPVITPLAEPSQAERSAACTVPSTS